MTFFRLLIEFALSAAMIIVALLLIRWLESISYRK